jgi:hypothetical protein
MSSEWQTIVALLLVALAVVALVRTAVKKKKSPGCGGDCGCPTDDFKTKLKS